MALTTDVTPRVHLTPQQVLQDTHRMKRLKAAFCGGVFSYADEPTAARIIEDSAQICGASPDTLSQVLQTKFFAEHTPFYWVIISKHAIHGTPPLLTKLFGACTLPLTKEAQEDVLTAFYARYDSDLYFDLKDKLPDVATHVPHNPSLFEGEGDRPVLTAVLEGDFRTRVELKIPRFFDRLVVDEAVILEFLAIDTHWRLKFLPTSSQSGSPYHGNTLQWKLELAPVDRIGRNVQIQNFHPSYGHFGFANNTGDDANFGRSLDQGSTNFLACTYSYSLSRFNDNPFTSNQNGELLCTIQIS